MSDVVDGFVAYVNDLEEVVALQKGLIASLQLKIEAQDSKIELLEETIAILKKGSH